MMVQVGSCPGWPATESHQALTRLVSLSSATATKWGSGSGGQRRLQIGAVRVSELCWVSDDGGSGSEEQTD